MLWDMVTFIIQACIFFHQKHICTLIWEVFKSLTNFNFELLSSFAFKDIAYNITVGPLLKLSNGNSNYCENNSVLFTAWLLRKAFSSWLDIVNIYLNWKGN